MAPTEDNKNSTQPGKEEGEEKQGSPQNDAERPPGKDVAPDGGRTSTVTRRPRRPGPLGRMEICND